MSRSTWACELKLQQRECWRGYPRHAPRERVSWNVTSYRDTKNNKGHAPRERVSWNLIAPELTSVSSGHAPRERVSWNSSSRLLVLSTWTSHAPRERVSWNRSISPMFAQGEQSRSTWACELKSSKSSSSSSSADCHAPRERVSWNWRSQLLTS